MNSVTQPAAERIAQKKGPGDLPPKTKPVFTNYVLPFVQWFALMVVIAIVIDFALHKFDLVFIGRSLGYVGTFILIGSFAYSLRKRKIIKSGSPKIYLQVHEYMAWVGSIILLVHAGVHFNALLPWLAVLMMVIAVASGLVGKFLLKKAGVAHKENLQLLVKNGVAKEEAEKRLFFDAIAVDLMKKWRMVHLPITLLFTLLALAHIITVFMFQK